MEKQLQQGFDPTNFSLLAKLEANNFWFRARNQLILWGIKKYFPASTSFLEVGCGTGFVISAVSVAFPDMELWGSELFEEGLKFASNRVPKAKFVQMDLLNMVNKNKYDIVGAFDVLEHIENDKLVLSNLYNAIKPGGGILLTVPQHKFLWSNSDEIACHVRRYEKSELQHKLINTGFRLGRMTSFVSLLFPGMLLSRLKQKEKSINYSVLDELHIAGPIGKSLEAVLSIERQLIKVGLDFPVGGSLFAVAYKG